MTLFLVPTHDCYGPASLCVVCTMQGRAFGVAPDARTCGVDAALLPAADAVRDAERAAADVADEEGIFAAVVHLKRGTLSRQAKPRDTSSSL